MQDSTGLDDFAMELFNCPTTEKPIYHAELSKFACDEKQMAEYKRKLGL